MNVFEFSSSKGLNVADIESPQFKSKANNEEATDESDKQAIIG